MSDILELSRSYLKANAAETGADVLIEELSKEVVRLRNLLRAPLTSAELKLVDKNCDWGILATASEVFDFRRIA
jgi:hypothetical protein